MSVNPPACSCAGDLVVTPVFIDYRPFENRKKKPSETRIRDGGTIYIYINVYLYGSRILYIRILYITRAIVANDAISTCCLRNGTRIFERSSLGQFRPSLYID